MVDRDKLRIGGFVTVNVIYVSDTDLGGRTIDLRFCRLEDSGVEVGVIWTVPDLIGTICIFVGVNAVGKALVGTRDICFR